MGNFKQAIEAEKTTTMNGMATFKTSLNKCVDAFFMLGALRGNPQKAVTVFKEAYAENKDIAIRIALRLRDVRQGSGERNLFRQILLTLESMNETETLTCMMKKVAELGRWDDILIFTKKCYVDYAFSLIQDEFKNNTHNTKNLCAKWMPRKGKTAVALAKYLELSPKQYRKLLVTNTNVVENAMCKNDWDNIEYAKVPSRAHKNYAKAFARHSYRNYSSYLQALTNKETKINVGTLYPYDIIHSLRNKDEMSLKLAEEQWKNLPNFMTDANILPVIDVSESMKDRISNKSSLTCMDVAVSLGLYCADKNKGTFKNIFCSFTDIPTLDTINEHDTLLAKINTIRRRVGYNTNLNAVFDNLLSLAIKNNISDEDMPKYIFVLSDMEFDCSDVKFSDTAQQMIERKYIDAGYNIPVMIYWNIASKSANIPVRYNKNNVGLVSGFDVNVIKTILAGKELNPEKLMYNAVCVPRYDYI